MNAIGWTSWLRSKTPVVGMPENLPLPRLAPGGGEEVGLGSATTEWGMWPLQQPSSCKQSQITAHTFLGPMQIGSS